MSEYMDKLFDYHEPKGIDPERYKNIRDKAKELATVVSIEGGARGMDIDKSIEHIRLAVYYAIASIVVPL